MINDKIEILKRMSNVIAGYAAYNTAFDAIKYENTVPEYKPTFDYKWEASENRNIISMIGMDTIDCASTLDRTSSLSLGIDIYYYIDNDQLSQIQIEVRDIKSTYGENTIHITDFVNDMVEHLITSAYTIVSDNPELSLVGSDTELVIDKNTKISVGFKKDNNVNLSLRSLFINDLMTSYTLDEKDGVVDSIIEYSETLGNNLKYVIANQKTEKTDIYKLSMETQPVDANQISNDYKEVVDVTTGKDLLYNMILRKIKRSNTASLSDIMTLCDGSDIDLTSINYIANF